MHLEAEITIQKKKGQFSTHWKTTKKNNVNVKIKIVGKMENKNVGKPTILFST